MHAKPRQDFIPNAHGETTLEKKAGIRLLALLAEWAQGPQIYHPCLSKPPKVQIVF